MEVIRFSSATLHPICAATIGFFDGVHRGHQYLIDRVRAVAKRENCRSAVITFPAPPQQIINPAFKAQLISTYEEKIEMLSEKGIDECIILDFNKELSSLSAKQFMNDILKEQFNVAHLIVGYDHRFGHDRREGYNDYVRYGEEIGISVEAVPAFEWHDRIISSSAIRQLLYKGNIEEANDALGYSYYIKGEVIKGHQMGRKMGFPTANIALNSDEKIVPKAGVYAVRVHSKGETYGGMLNIGHRPTLDNGNDTSIEAHILDFDKDIYGCPICISFIKYIRKEQKFPSIAALIQQLNIDKETIEKILEND
ncbi:MAG: bifunctional riboflavin kinase/FAD synthetase [Bacteroidales bacterium]|nr:bifunctional riboflavin kinase/FAD synthetase [Bacteroidales bacterium]